MINITSIVDMKDRIFEAVALTLLCFWSASAAMAAPPADAELKIKTVVAKVGDRPITREDIIHMIQIEKFYKTPALSESGALYIVMQDAIAHEVAHSVGIDVTPSETPQSFPFVTLYTPNRAEDKKAQGTQPPLEQPFHVDHQSYAELYVIPKIIDRKLRNYFNTSSYIHNQEREQINQALQLAISGMGFAEVAHKTGLMTARHQMDMMDSPNQIPGLPADKHLPKKETVFDILDKLSPGEIYPDVLQDEVGYRVLRLISRNGQKYSFETIEAPKQQYESWLRERASKLIMTISDDELKREMKKDFSNVDWVERI